MLVIFKPQKGKDEKKILKEATGSEYLLRNKGKNCI